MQKFRGGIFAVLAAAVVLTASAEATTYQVDPDHTSVTFHVRHLFTQVQGRFDRFGGSIQYDPQNPDKTKVEGWIDVGSINTNVAERDKDLRSKRFFDVEKYPRIQFVSTGVRDVDVEKRTGKLVGLLTIRGTARPVILDVAFLGEGKDPWGNQRAGFSAQTTINRKDFGLTWNETLETGGLLVGEEVRIEIQAEALVSE